MCTYMCTFIYSDYATHKSAGRQGTTFTNRKKVNNDSVHSHAKGYTHTGTTMYTTQTTYTHTLVYLPRKQEC